jgi:Tfp pilus assembly protein PilO
MAIKLTKQQQQMIGLGVLILGGVGYSYFTFFWIPISKKIKKTSDDITAIESKIQKAQQQAGRLSFLQAELVRLNDQAVENEARLPKQKSVADILVTVSGLAEKNHIDLVSFAPGPTVNKPNFFELNYPVSVKGTYHSIGKFFASVALEQRIFNISNVNYGQPDQATGMMTVTFTLVSYQYKG